jgi:hypothetical protein
MARAAASAATPSGSAQNSAIVAAIVTQSETAKLVRHSPPSSAMAHPVGTTTPSASTSQNSPSRWSAARNRTAAAGRSAPMAAMLKRRLPEITRPYSTDEDGMTIR